MLNVLLTYVVFRLVDELKLRYILDWFAGQG